MSIFFFLENLKALFGFLASCFWISGAFRDCFLASISIFVCLGPLAFEHSHFQDHAVDTFTIPKETSGRAGGSRLTTVPGLSARMRVDLEHHE